MPETVCVTVEQLKGLVWDDKDRCVACYGRRTWETSHSPVCWLGNAIAQAERLKDWKPKVGDRVRLKAMPVLQAVVAAEYNGEAVYIDVNGKRVMRQLDELMPAEGE